MGQRIMPRAVVWRLIVVALFVSPMVRTASAESLSSHRANELERLVRQDCGSCHGMTLKGGLGPDIRGATLKGADPETIAQIILDGVPGTPMPPWRPLMSEDEALWIANYLLKETD